MKQHNDAVQHSSKLCDWRTPVQMFACADREFQFVLDAAATKENKLCPHYFGPDQADLTLRDALSVDWREHIGGLYQLVGILSRCAVWCNPPFSRELASAFTTGKIKNADGVWVPHPINLRQAEAMKIGNWLQKFAEESRKGVTIVSPIPYSPQTDWWREYVEGHGRELKDFHAAREVRKLPHRASFLKPDGTEAANAGNNTALVVWKGGHGLVAPWVPFNCYWEYL